MKIPAVGFFFAVIVQHYNLLILFECLEFRNEDGNRLKIMDFRYLQSKSYITVLFTWFDGYINNIDPITVNGDECTPNTCNPGYHGNALQECNEH